MYTYRRKTTTQPQRRLQKRWYVDASIPKSVPIIGGSSFKAGSGTLTKRSLGAAVKQAIHGTSALKLKAIDGTVVTNFQANTHYTLNPLGNIPIGTGENARIGSDIYVKQIAVSFNVHKRLDLVAPKLGAPIYLRLMWVRSESNVLASTDTFSSGLGTSDLYKDGFSATINAPLDKSKVSVLSDRIYVLPQSNMTTANDSLHINSVCPLENFTFKYATNTSGYSVVNKNVYLVAFAFTHYGLTAIDPLLDYTYTACVDFVDGR